MRALPRVIVATAIATGLPPRARLCQQAQKFPNSRCASSWSSLQYATDFTARVFGMKE